MYHEAQSKLPNIVQQRRGFGRFRFAGDERALLIGALRLADIAALAAAGAAAYAFWHSEFEVPERYWLQIAIGCAFAAQALQLAGRYRNEKFWRWSFAPSLVGWTAAVLAVPVLIYFAKEGESFSRAWIAIWWAFGCATLIAIDLGFRSVLRLWVGRGKLTSRVAVFGAPADAERIARQIDSDPYGHRRVVAIFHQFEREEPDRGSELNDLLRLARQVRIDEVILTACVEPNPELAEALVRLGSLPTDVKLCLRHPAGAGGGPIDLPPIPIHQRPLAGSSALKKRAADIVLSSMALIAVLPLMLVIAAAVKLDSPGPVIYRQRRAGFNLKTFTVYKFRTMYTEAGNDPTVRQAQRNDARVTRVGSLLRRTSLDELPQLINVLLGEMSLVGPRPHAVPHDEKYGRLIDGYLLRHRVRPGITGWAQVNGFRGETDTLEKMRARIEHDLWYIENWSLGLDITILLRTVFHAWNDEHAY